MDESLGKTPTTSVEALYLPVQALEWVCGPDLSPPALKGKPKKAKRSSLASVSMQDISWEARFQGVHYPVELGVTASEEGVDDHQKLRSAIRRAQPVTAK